MKHKNIFNEDDAIKKIKHYLPSQAPLKDFIHHNTLHAFQHMHFHDALAQASSVFGYKVYLQLDEYRSNYRAGKINPEIFERTIIEKKGKEKFNEWKEKLLNTNYNTNIEARIGKLTSKWPELYRINLNKLVHPFLFQLLSTYLDQGIAIWNFPVTDKGFLSSIRELDKNSMIRILKSERARNLLIHSHCSIRHLLSILIGREELFETYLFDQLFEHPGWSGMVSIIEDHPHALLDKRKISLRDLIVLELLMQIDILDCKFQQDWQPLGEKLNYTPLPLFSTAYSNELQEVYGLWQEIYEWTYYDSVLSAVQVQKKIDNISPKEDLQAVFCIDDRECSMRRHLEYIAPHCKTFGTPGFFNVEMYYQPELARSYTKICPAPLEPTHLIKGVHEKSKRKKEPHFRKQSHSLFSGWIISQTLGFWSMLKLFINVFKPGNTAAAVSSFNHMHKTTKLTIKGDGEQEVHGLKIGFTVPEMADRMEGLLKSIGLVKDFSPIVYFIGHGASSVNNTHYAGYDCGACSGRPGSVNARVAAYMCNQTEVRKILSAKKIDIPEQTQFLGALHDTTRDEIEYYDEEFLSFKNKSIHKHNMALFDFALLQNAKERSRRFILTDSALQPKKVHDKMKLRSVSLFEPRPEYNHATNSLCIIGRRELTAQLFLDRRSFLNSYDYRIDPEGKYLLSILNAAAPVCGGINLEYYFSRVDNHKLGAGTKLPHNVIGLIGVANGMDGDLRTGLPYQMVEVHDPIRLLMIVEHFPEMVLNTLKKSTIYCDWFITGWIHLVVVHPETKQLLKFESGRFIPYHTLTSEPTSLIDFDKLVETNQENIPIQYIN